ncbi:hypothetical protein J0B03_12115 [Alkalibacter rhizosphaerae]|uniref:Lipoprotein n=1 Tax=Alkalibacter rhizosphaerae TaxID=2815577 RepID=A0A974XER7_9FIRM|nr:hypothetical protein [Alkalibacter rhizosphaerae]QSX08507.1 hypothetical protein J0B03_12115 [Alkalibacter rhizosphaerae]
MLKKMIAVGLVLLVLTSGAACSSTTAFSEDPAKETPTDETVDAGENVGQGLGIPGTFGEIKEVVGNEVTLLLMANAAEEEAPVPGSGMKRGSQGGDVLREYTGEELTILIPVGTPIVKRVQQSPTTETGTGAGTGPVEEEVALTELVKGSTLKIFYYDADKKSIEKILIQPPKN